jgi:FkbM family methyltransferase
MSGRQHHVSVSLLDKAAAEFDILHYEHWPETGQSSYEPEVSNTMARFVRPGDFAIDVGANIGWFTIILSRLVGENGLVLALEPDPRNFQILLDNVSLNQIVNVQAVEVALCEQDCTTKFWMMDHGGYSSLIKYANSFRYKELLARSLDSLLAPSMGLVPRVIKIDCEGAEESILRGAEKVLRQGVDCVIVEFNFQIMKSERQIRDFMYGLGYDFFFIRSNGIEEPIFLNPGYGMAASETYTINVLFSTKDKVKQAWGK